MSEIPGRLVTYCTNVHPGESWEETFDSLRAHVPVVKRAVSPGEPFPIGLRLSDRAARELNPEKNRAFRDWLDQEDCFVPTVNGFPFASFHREAVKEKVYLPDWRSPERADYTVRLAGLLAGWLPPGVTGSISSVPLAFKSFIDRSDLPEIRRQLESVLTRLGRIREETGRSVLLALEPEPGCWLETTEEVCRFFAELSFPEPLMRHLGLCYDCCHQAVEFEDPAHPLQSLISAGIPLAKVQVSSALQLPGGELGPLMALDEPCYLHQVVARRRDGALLRYSDLPQALALHEPRPGDELRCHFHVPIFQERTRTTGTTREFLDQFLPKVPPTVLLEVETYTWEVLPEELRCGSVTDSIIREIRWLKERLHA